MKKRGLTLIELVVVIALLAILAVVLAPRLRDQVAKAGDSKAIALLGALRGASESYYAGNGKTPSKSIPSNPNDFNSIDDINDDDRAGIDILKEGLNNESKGMFVDSGYTVKVGGVRESEEGGISYSEEIGFTFHAPAGATADGISLWFTERAMGTEDGRHDTKGKRWIEY